MAERIVVGVLAVWFVLSILAQFEFKTSRWIRSQDALKLVQSWRLFNAPSSGDYQLVDDHYLLWRCMGTENTALSGWIEIRFAAKRIPYAWLWNPGRRDRASIIQALKWLSDEHQRNPEQSIKLALPYQLFQRCVERCVPASVSRFQFAILHSRRDGSHPPVKFLIVSHIHEVHNAV